MLELTCIVCPQGCRISVEQKESEVLVSGNGCKRGEVYAREEVVAPKRVLTSVVSIKNTKKLLPVKTATAIPKEKIFCAMRELETITVEIPIRVGQVIKDNIAGTGVILVATKNIE